MTQFLVSLFFLFFLPGLLGIVFLVLTAPWFDRWLYPYVGKQLTYYILKFALFTALTYLITRTYVKGVLEAIQTQATIVEN